MSQNETKLPVGITQEQINEAVQKYGEGKVKLAQLPLDDEGKEFKNVLIHEPDVNCVGQYQQWSDKNWKKANELLIRGTIIGKENCDEIIASTGLFLAAVDASMAMFPVRKSVVKNL